MKKTNLIVIVFALVVAVVPVFLFFGYAGPAMHKLEAQNQKLIQQVENHQKVHEARRSALRSRRFSENPKMMDDVALPTKWAAKYLTPRYYQEDRGLVVFFHKYLNFLIENRTQQNKTNRNLLGIWNSWIP